MFDLWVRAPFEGNDVVVYWTDGDAALFLVHEKHERRAPVLGPCEEPRELDRSVVRLCLAPCFDDGEHGVLTLRRDGSTKRLVALHVVNRSTWSSAEDCCLDRAMRYDSGLDLGRSDDFDYEIAGRLRKRGILLLVEPREIKALTDLVGESLLEASFHDPQEAFSTFEILQVFVELVEGHDVLAVSH
jgi:hypothetical protein